MGYTTKRVQHSQDFSALAGLTKPKTSSEPPTTDIENSDFKLSKAHELIKLTSQFTPLK